MNAFKVNSGATNFSIGISTISDSIFQNILTYSGQISNRRWLKWILVGNLSTPLTSRVEHSIDVAMFYRRFIANALIDGPIIGPNSFGVIAFIDNPLWFSTIECRLFSQKLLPLQLLKVTLNSIIYFYILILVLINQLYNYKLKINL